METMLQLSTLTDCYEHAEQYVRDELIMLDVRLELELEQISALKEGSERAAAYPGMYFSEEEAFALLSSDTAAELSSEQQQLLEQLEQRIAAKANNSKQKGERLPVHVLEGELGLHSWEVRVLIAALAPHIDRKYWKLYGYIQDDMNCQHVTLELLLRICCKSKLERRLLYKQLTNPHSVLRSMLLSYPVRSADESSVLKETLTLGRFMIHFLLGISQTSGLGIRRISEEELNELPPLLIHQETHQQIIHYAKTQGLDKGLIWNIHGEAGSGKNFQAMHAARSLGFAYMEMSLLFAPADLPAFRSKLEQFMLEARLYNALPVLDHMDELVKGEETDVRLLWLADRLQQCDRPILLLSRKEFRGIGLRSRYINVHLPLPHFDQSRLLWQQLSGSWMELKDYEAQRLAGKFRFTPGYIAAAADQAGRDEEWCRYSVNGEKFMAESELGADRKVKRLHQSAYRIVQHQLEQKAVKVDPKFEWSDLILPEDTIGLLRQACNRVKNRYQVMQVWGFDRVLPYGRGVSMMFTGPPGTGKTMSALVMAREMDAELYRIDLSRVVSKYIGETEKNLSDIFDQARKSGAILFFDEADSLFGKRSEVKDSHDKYANMETSFLLQKMEEYDGLTILATNFAQNLDEAFTRRIQFIIKYPFPDTAQREQLWRASLPKQLHSKSLDFTFLAQTFELTGGPIKNIILTAAFLAAEEGSELHMKHMVEGAIQEYKKTGKLLLKDRLGPYAQYWRG
ncbi:ATP-binding protein [Paenibacillus sp. IITD108]|uniref:ATP-binding protein n=1 Tax=Paenibacillus sp. IITD108 TaxID=3116649 RepID=UPI002F3E9E83